MAHAVVITQVYLDEHGHGVVTCRQCGVTGPLTLAESWEASRGHTYPMTCRACHHICQIYFVRRRHRRQPVHQRQPVGTSAFEPVRSIVISSPSTITFVSTRSRTPRFRASSSSQPVGAWYTPSGSLRISARSIDSL